MSNPRKIQNALLALVLSAMLSTLAACGADTLGPDGGPGPAVPNVAGNWFGTFGDANFSLQISQSGSQVTGMLIGPRTSYPVEGSVSAVGLFTWSSTLDTQTCDAYSSPRGLTLGAGGSTLGGAAQRTSLSRPCVGTDRGRVHVSQGSMQLSRG